MRKTLAATIATTALIFGLAPTANAATPDFPNVPACVDPSVGGGDVNAPWADIETDCGLVVAGDQRAFVTFVEDYADHLNALLAHAGADLAAQSDQLAAQRQKIAKQRATIQRLRARLANTR